MQLYLYKGTLKRKIISSVSVIYPSTIYQKHHSYHDKSLGKTGKAQQQKTGGDTSSKCPHQLAVTSDFDSVSWDLVYSLAVKIDYIAL